MEVDSLHAADLVALAVFALGFAALFGIHLTVTLTDIRRELRSLNRRRRADFIRPTDAGDARDIGRCPNHPTSKEEQT